MKGGVGVEKPLPRKFTKRYRPSTLEEELDEETERWLTRQNDRAEKIMWEEDRS